VNLRFALASEVPDLGDFMQLHPVSTSMTWSGTDLMCP
jgi:hypothetical protein